MSMTTPLRTHNQLQSQNQLRNYEPSTPQHRFYIEQHTNQSYNYVMSKYREMSVPSCRTIVMTMREALSKLDQYVDPSDPDVDLPNSYHAYQTAEMVRRDHPDDEEFQVVGLIHDVGKVLYEFGEPSWAVVGDTFVVGCAFAPSIVYPDTFDSNPDKDDVRFNTKLGIYEAGCGIENLQLSFGHDEYLHSVLVRNPTAHRLSKRSLAQIRFHSFYPWHTGGDYGQFEAPGDDLLKRDVLEFNKYDLYSKAVVDGDMAERDIAERDMSERDESERDDDTATNANNNRFRLTDDMIRYYDRLLEKFFPEPIRWMAPNQNCTRPSIENI